MSSHHIVREKQEPALIIKSYNNFNDEYLGQLLEWSPTVIVFEEEWDLIVSKGIKIDVVLVGNEIKNDQFQEFTKVIVLEPFGLSKAIEQLINDGYPSVNIIGTFNDLSVIEHYINQIDIVLLNDDRKIFPVKNHLEKWYAKNEELFVINQHASNDYQVEGASKVKNATFLTETNGLIRFKTKSSPIFIAEELK